MTILVPQDGMTAQGMCKRYAGPIPAHCKRSSWPATLFRCCAHTRDGAVKSHHERW